ncbi:unnamed protein product [Rotaria socialis]|uniref:Uncharacterized protein n=1 Tax=Rotaria socialis TaxID=392032 RepID=A0A818ZD35_9BILA|nr:unnamed protein product [Rotaria socialis]
MKQEAPSSAEKIAPNVTNQSKRWGPAASVTLVHQLIEVLFTRGIRRGSIPIEQQDLRMRKALVRNCLAYDKGLRFFYSYVTISDAKKSDLLIQELSCLNCTIAWFLQSVKEVLQVETNSIHLFIVQDGRRYPYYDTDLDEHIQAYSKCLQEIIVQLDINENIILTSHDKLE